jgi:class 3 adenylate cyclase
MTAAKLSCGSCGTELLPNSKFCNECGAAVASPSTPAEYKQVTVLFADVVHSMDIAAAVGPERLRDDRLGMRDIWLLRMRALLARAHGDAEAYVGFRDRYRDMAKAFGFEGHIEWAEAMP